MTENTYHTGPHRRLVFTNNGVRIEEEQAAEVGTTWETVAFLDEDELRQLVEICNKDTYDVFKK